MHDGFFFFFLLAVVLPADFSLCAGSGNVNITLTLLHERALTRWLNAQLGDDP